MLQIALFCKHHATGTMSLDTRYGNTSDGLSYPWLLHSLHLSMTTDHLAFIARQVANRSI
jgi:hypothetical protein